MFGQLIARAKLYNQHKLAYIESKDPLGATLEIHSQYSLFRLSVWLDGYCEAYNTLMQNNAPPHSAVSQMFIIRRSKYLITIRRTV